MTYKMSMPSVAPKIAVMCDGSYGGDSCFVRQRLAERVMASFSTAHALRKKHKNRLYDNKYGGYALLFL